MNIWITDPKTKEPSVTLTAFIGGFVVAISKLALSGVVVWGYSIPVFTGADFSLVIAALGGLYWARRNSPSEAPKDE